MAHFLPIRESSFFQAPASMGKIKNGETLLWNRRPILFTNQATETSIALTMKSTSIMLLNTAGSIGIVMSALTN